MSFITSMQQRYTTKKYNASKKIESEKIKELQQVLQLSPSSINSQPWKFTFVSDTDTKEQLSKVSWLNTSKVIESDTIVVFNRINDIDLFEKQIEEELPEGAVGYYKEFIKPKPEEEIKAWFNRQVYLALGVFLSACAEMGIDATPMEGIEPENYDKILNNKDYATVVAVAIGYRDEEDFNQPDRKPKSRLAFNKVIETV
ncbi:MULTISPECIES: nitroreductase family protein [Tenacibaculum]|uniref:nitroreductase family protein n=1 Tax=Tenacibaculum TaxID=104267 RepID=UPI00064B269B|nr:MULTISPECIES: nitroreductase family protein [Tenacibaculum]KAF9658244.1 nitroreductase family protein [Tenacibaculum mesophilum]MCG7502925.1 nitroreductase family protein [Tenacibaculum sp. Mcav3-52]BFF41595.1 oxygen-insensitive NAD(P)H nitroreductase [Tenacibaculum mesophilum]SHF90660.1 nitroreductase / dihydropteridine reductase [Tenacibaculum mesophilum]